MKHHIIFREGDLTAWFPRASAPAIAASAGRVTSGAMPPIAGGGVAAAGEAGAVRAKTAGGAGGEWRFWSGREELAAFAGAAVAFLLWALSLSSFDVDPFAMSGFGLLNVAPLPWFLAAGVSAISYLAFSVRGNVRAWPLIALHASLVTVLYGTTAALYDYPRATWTYKHIGVVEYLLAGNGVDRSIDIYHNWPGFFVLSAGVAKLTGISPMTQARFAEPLFGLLIGLAVYYAVGGLTRSRRLRWGATALFTIANWIGQGYFAPQALATLLLLIFLGAFLRAGVLTDQPRRWAGALLRRMRLEDVGPREAGASHRGSAPLALAAFALLVTTHQLTPVAVLMQVGALAVLYRVRRWWFLLVIAALQAAWMGFAWQYTSLHYRIVSFDVEQSVRMPVSVGVASLPGMQIAKWGGPVICATIALLALGGLVTALRRRGVPLAGAALAGAPLAIFAMNSYGSEALLRVYLYALPCLALLGAAFLVGDERRSPYGAAAPVPGGPAQRWRTARAIVAAGVLIPVVLTANFWMERSYLLQKSDIDVATYFETKTPADSFALMVDASYPSRLTGNYPSHMITDGADAPALTSFLLPKATAEDVLAAARRAFRQYNWRPGYLVFSPSQKAYAQMWGWISPSEYDRAMALVRASSDYQVAYRADGAMLARYRGATH